MKTSSSKPDLQRISLMYDRYAQDLGRGNGKGRELVPMMLDYLLQECCSPAIQAAFVKAVLATHENDEDEPSARPVR